jgi:hypothetical protein
VSGKGAREDDVNGGGGGVCFRAREDGGCLNRWLDAERQFTSAKFMRGHNMGTTWARRCAATQWCTTAQPAGGSAPRGASKLTHSRHE